jgi:hypothetical protein
MVKLVLARASTNSAWRVPFLPTRAGLGSDVLTLMPDLRTVTFDPATGSPSAVPYLDDFPFPNYVLVRDTAGLPRALGGVIRQWVDAAAAAGER